MFDFDAVQYVLQNAVLVLTLILSAVSVALVSVLVSVQVIAPRAKARRERWLVLWRNDVMQSLSAEAQTLPFLPRSRRKAFLRLRAWHDVRARLRGESTEGMARFAILNGVERTARQLLRSRSLYKRLLAIESLGYLGCREEIPALERVMNSTDPYTSLAAAWALVRIDSTHYTAPILTAIAQRMDWSVNQARLMLYDMERENVRSAAENILGTASPKEQARLLNICNVVYPYLMADVVYARLGDAASWATTPSAVVVQYLKTFRRRRALPIVQGCLGYTDRAVRAAAAEALGRFGGSEEVPLLVALLDDDEWLVRSAAAKALCEMPMLGQSAIEDILLHARTEQARGAMRHILAEYPHLTVDAITVSVITANVPLLEKEEHRD